MKTKKILYLFSDTGGGHRTAANAIISAISKIAGKNAPRQEMVDVFAECSGFLNIFARMYGPVIKYYPKMWGRLYHWLDDEEVMRGMEKIARPFIRKELARLILNRNPDLIVSVHPLLNHFTVQAIKDIGKEIPMVTVVTDLVTVHRVWVCPEVDLIITPTEEAGIQCIGYGMERRRAKVIGMPIHPKFLELDKTKMELRHEMSLNPKLFTILIMGGGEGAGRMDKIIEAIDASRLKVQLIVIAGRNKKLLMKLEINLVKYKVPMKIFGFTDQVPALMEVSDILITKAGPGTIAEAEAKVLPLIITSWLPGQEEGNVTYVLNKKIGLVAKEPKRIVEVLKELLIHKNRIAEMKQNIIRTRRPRAVFEIADILLNFLLTK